VRTGVGVIARPRFGAASGASTLGFAVASAIGGAADSFLMLVSARALQGAFGAILAPAALGTLVSTFRDPRERGRAFAVFGSVAVGGGAVGLLLGGLLTQYLSWRRSDESDPGERPFTGMLDRHPTSAFGRGGCSLLLSRLLSVVFAQGSGSVDPGWVGSPKVTSMFSKLLCRSVLA
jgi:MFS family permease